MHACIQIIKNPFSTTNLSSLLSMLISPNMKSLFSFIGHVITTNKQIVIIILYFIETILYIACKEGRERAKSLHKARNKLATIIDHIIYTNTKYNI